MKVLLFIAFAAIMVYVYSQEIDPECPDFNDEEIVYLPNPCNCSSYYVCSLTGKIVMPCPKGLHFNQEKKVCDWPKRAKCKVSPDCPPPKPHLEYEEPSF
ncbi:peritrophin-1-like [Megachile rotundata]|uniref:peritrophin-1-like n=1 Tax=Megachile rotundata TaxID=143995 RepID=UPI000258E423|nr:PREDICTED: peritrophin-1-like [Megachile rotundata]